MSEIKFSKEEVKPEVIQQMQHKIAQFYLPRGFSIMPVLIYVNGVTEHVVESQYFSQLVDFSELLKP